MFNKFSYEISKVFRLAELEMQDLNHPYVGSEHLFLSLLKNDDEVSKKLNEYEIDYASFRDELVKVVGTSRKKSEVVLYTPLLKRIIDTAMSDAIQNNNGEITTRHLLIGLLDEGEGVAIRLLVGMDVDLSSIYKELMVDIKKSSSKKSLSIYEHGILMNDSVDMAEVVVGRDEEINNIIETLLRKNKNNPLLLGKAGVGKTAIVEELVRRIERKEVPGELLDKSVVMLEMGALVSGTKYRGEFEERLNGIIKDITGSDDIILFIDEIHTIVGAGGAEGAIDASNILKPYLARGNVKCIGATTINEYNKYIAKDKALERRFQVVNVLEPTVSETEVILTKIKPAYESHHNVVIGDNLIKKIVGLANKYIHNKNNPDKCIDILDSVCAKTKAKYDKTNEMVKKENDLDSLFREKELAVTKGDYEAALKIKSKEKRIKRELENLMSNRERKITEELILEVIESKAGVPIVFDRASMCLKVEDSLRSSIYGQDEAISKVMRQVKRRVYEAKNGPVSLLLVGPSGVGKTETVKKISETLFKRDNLVRLDMSEYNLDISVNKLIGVSAGYVGYDDEYVFEAVKQNPYSVILVDEIEKTSKKVLNLFLQILDEGYITDAKGEKIFFDNTLIFMTSNVVCGNSVGFNASSDESLNEILSKELVGRLDEVVYYKELDRETVLKYALKYLKDNNLELNLDEIVEKSDYKTYGMRNIKKIINDKLMELEYADMEKV